MTRRAGLILIGLTLGGLAFYWLTSAEPGRACGSYLIGLVLATAVFTVSTAAVDLFAKASPSMGLAVATLSYTTTVLLMAALLSAASPTFVDGAALALGLVLATVVGLGSQIARAWVH